MEIGSIVYLKNIIFDQKEVDHAFNKGRPCIFIGEIDDKMIFIPIIHLKKYYLYNRYKIKQDFSSNGLIKDSCANIKQIIEKPIAFYPVSGVLSAEDMLEIFKKILNYYKMIIDDKGAKLVTLAHDYLDKYESVKYVDKDNKKNKENKKE